MHANGYPVVCRRGNGKTIPKNGVIIDNIMPYHPKLQRENT